MTLYIQAFQQAIGAFMTYCESKAWSDRLDAFINHEFFEVIAPHTPWSSDELADKVDEQEDSDTVLLVMWMDTFMRQRYEQAPHNPLEDFLKRRGWKLSPLERTQIQRLIHSEFSVYEVCDVDPGVSLTVRDRLLEGPETLLFEKSGSQGVTPMDTLVAKIVTDPDGRRSFTGMAWVIDSSQIPPLRERALTLMEELGLSADVLAGTFLPDEALPVLEVMMWEILGAAVTARFTERTFVNADGEEILWHKMRWQVLDEEAVIDRLDTLPDLHPAEDPDDPDDQPFWNWSETEPSAPGVERDKDQIKPAVMPLNSLMVDTWGDGHYLNLGTIELKTPQLLYSEANSRSRAERLIAMLNEVLGDAVSGPPTIQTEGMGTKARKLRLVDEGETRAIARPSSISAEEEAEILGEVMRSHYEGLADEVIPALGNRTPRQCAKADPVLARRWCKGAQIQAQQHHGYDLSWLSEFIGLEAEPLALLKPQ